MQQEQPLTVENLKRILSDYDERLSRLERIEQANNPDERNDCLDPISNCCTNLFTDSRAFYWWHIFNQHSASIYRNLSIFGIFSCNTDSIQTVV